MMATTRSDSALRSAEPHLETTRLPLERIVLPMDFSASSQAALLGARRVAQRFNSTLVLVHPVPPVIALEANTSEKKLTTNFEFAKAKLSEVAKQLNAEGIRHDVIFSSAPAIECIQDVTRRIKADLVVVGSNGAHGIEKPALGSVAEAALRSSYTPVMVVGPNCKTESATAVYKSVLFASDLAPSALRAAQYASAIAEDSRGRLVVAHVEPTPGTAELSVHDMYERIQRFLPTSAELWCKPSILVDWGNLSDHILATAREEKSDLIVFATPPAGPLSDQAPWSTVSEIIRGAICPVLVVRANSA